MENNNLSRRQFLKDGSKAGIAAGLSVTVMSGFLESCNAAHAQAAMKSPFATSFQQQPLPYDYKALEPNIDAQTMEIHFTKHAATYTKNLAEAAIAEGVDASKMSLEDLLSKISKYSAKMRNNGGGHYNHELFWQCMTPKPAKPAGSLLTAINRDFGSLDTFKTQFSDAGKNRFGSGWAWLVLKNDKKLAIGSTPNQDNPLMDVSELKGVPLLGLDVWEHAYYLKYQNKRPDYITNWWNVVNWSFVQNRYDKLMS